MSQSRPTEHEITIYASEYILNGGNQVAAWRKAYPKNRAKAGTQVIRASEMHKKKGVLERIFELQAEQRKQDEENFNLTAAEVKKRLDLIYKAAMIFQTDKEGNKKPNAPSAAVSALREINQMNGFHAPRKTELSNPDGSLRPTLIDPTKLSNDALEEILRAMDDTD